MVLDGSNWAVLMQRGGERNSEGSNGICGLAAHSTTRSLTLTHSHSLSLTLTHSHSLTLTHSLTHSLTLSHFHPLTRTHTLELQLTHSLTHFHPLTRTHSNSRARTLEHAVAFCFPSLPPRPPPPARRRPPPTHTHTSTCCSLYSPPSPSLHCSCLQRNHPSAHHLAQTRPAHSLAHSLCSAQKTRSRRDIDPSAKVGERKKCQERKQPNTVFARSALILARSGRSHCAATAAAPRTHRATFVQHEE